MQQIVAFLWARNSQTKMQIFTRIMRFPTQNSALQNNKLEKKRMKWDENHNRCFIWWSMRFLCSHFQHSIKLHRRAFSLELLKNFIFPGTIQMDRKCITKGTPPLSLLFSHPWPAFFWSLMSIPFFKENRKGYSMP